MKKRIIQHGSALMTALSLLTALYFVLSFLTSWLFSVPYGQACLLTGNVLLFMLVIRRAVIKTWQKIRQQPFEE